MDFRFPDGRLPALPDPMPVNVAGCFQPESSNSFLAPQRSPWPDLMRVSGAQEWMHLAGLRRAK
jgi:hypothetical protein